MKKRLSYAVFIVSLAAYVLTGAQVDRQSNAAEKDDAYPQLELFSRVLQRVRKDYVDGDKLTYKELVQGALKGMLGTLDPHSEYMEPVKYNELKEDTEGTFSGVGLQVGMRDGGLTVIAPIEDTPAFEAGIMAGDHIDKIDGQPTDKFNMADAIQRLRGDPGSKVTLTISRPAWTEAKDIALSRADIRVYTVKDLNNRREFTLGPNRVGYVRLTQFGEKSAEELEEALVKLEGQGMTGLVLDLRGNPGGLLDQAVSICEKFLKKGEPIVSTEGRNAAADVQRKSSGFGKKRLSLPLVLLVNGGSASASEIVSGCLQDLGRAVVVGEQTFGKGSVQSILPLPDGSALRLTTAKYYTPSHKVIHEHGIAPDIQVPITEEEETAIQLRRLPGGGVNVNDVLRNYEPEKRERLRELVRDQRDPQLERAQDLLTGIRLFGQRPVDKTEKAARPVLR